MPPVNLEFATTTRTGKLLEWLRTDAARIRNGSPSAEWPHSSAAAFVLAHRRPFAVDDIGASQRRLARSVAATHWRAHGPFQHREPALNAQRCLFLDELERFVYAEGFVWDDRVGYPEQHAWLSLDDHVVDFTAAVPGAPPRGSEPLQLMPASREPHLSSLAQPEPSAMRAANSRPNGLLAAENEPFRGRRSHFGDRKCRRRRCWRGEVQ
jgi:hypothetical protein